MSTPSAVPHIVILGGGFGGLWATRALRSAPVRITLVDRTNHHLFQPLLYQVATAGLSGPDIAAPLRHILRRQRNVTVRMDEARGIDLRQRRVALAGGTLDYDYLLVATGSSHAYFGHDDWARHAPGMKTMDDALAIRRRILSAFEAAEREPDPARRAAWLSFVVIGAGPTGVELAGTLAEIAHHTLRDEFREADPRTAQIHLVEAGPRVLAAMPPTLSAEAQRRLERMGVRVHLGAAVTGVDEAGVQVDAQRIEARTVLWAAGVAASSLGAQLGAPCDRAGRVLVEPDLSLPGHPEVFVAGDLAHVEQDGRLVPGQAPAAKQMGLHVAGAIGDRLAGRTTRAFRYRDYGSLASIGRGAAVVDVRGMRLSGLFAWWFWLVAHIFFLIGFRNRLVVMLDWAWSYCTWQRNARIIVGKGNDDDDDA
ncbi:pyridine nucleotide-disulfide oxidoreductase [Frateuria sp. Soil773]|uniref:NAD(P)/FAD-dependent oxidoreductase n=1 Tax=Frateuria sp. Soil773 TaxID=1736407 RepID=UPI0006F5CE06|nr:NAD(P)/FAD-dependent oxidoreductase [Frateuria sp. Soil773]KRE89110.1 pyridine nucleotide-disulfide oxidoreductase [Frateuria sp. Soil773]